MQLKPLLDALLKVTEAASAAGVELPAGLASCIFDLGTHLAEDALIHRDNVSQILADLEAVFAKESVQPPAVKTALADAAKALAAAKTATQVASTVLKPFDSVPAIQKVDAVVADASKVLG